MNGIYLYFVNKHLSSWPLLGLKNKRKKNRKKCENATISPFLHNVFYTLMDKFYHLSPFNLLSASAFEFGNCQKFCLAERGNLTWHFIIEHCRNIFLTICFFLFVFVILYLYSKYIYI